MCALGKLLLINESVLIITSMSCHQYESNMGRVDTRNHLYTTVSPMEIHGVSNYRIISCHEILGTRYILIGYTHDWKCFGVIPFSHMAFKGINRCYPANWSNRCWHIFIIRENFFLGQIKNKTSRNNSLESYSTKWWWYITNKLWHFNQHIKWPIFQRNRRTGCSMALSKVILMSVNYMYYDIWSYKQVGEKGKSFVKNWKHRFVKYYWCRTQNKCSHFP